MPTRTGAKKHTHKYHKMPNGIWACGLSDCTHFMPGNIDFMIENKRSKCWKCDGELIMAERQRKMTKPECDECIMKGESLNVNVSELMKHIEDRTAEFKVSDNHKLSVTNINPNNEDELV